MIGSKVMTILTMFFINTYLGFLLNQSTVDYGGFSRDRSVAVGVSGLARYGHHIAATSLLFSDI